MHSNVSFNKDDELNLYEVLNENGNFIATKTEEVFQTFFSPGKAIIQGDLFGWTNKKDFVLDIPISLYSVAGMQTNGVDLLSFWIQPELTLLQPLIGIEIKLGRNQQIVQRPEMNTLAGATLIAIDNNYNWAERIMLAELGMPYSLNYSNINEAILAAASTTSVQYANTCQIGDVSFEAANQYNQLKTLLYSSSLQGSPIATSIGLPLSFINTFFRENEFLPPNLHFRIEISFNPAFIAMGTNSAFNSLASLTTYPFTPSLANTYTFGGAWANGNSSSFSLKYKSYFLREDLQLKISDMWKKKPFLYQLYNYDVVVMPFDGVNMTFTQRITLNQARPTRIIMRPMLQGNSPIIPLNLGFSFPNVTSPGVSIYNVTATIAGKNNYELKISGNPGIFQYEMPKGAVMMFNDIVNARTSPNSLVTSKSNSICIGQLFYFTINPGDFLNKKSLTEGAIKIDLTFTAAANPTNASELIVSAPIPVPNTLKMVIYKRSIEGIVLDHAHNLQAVNFPAQFDSNRFLLPADYNMN